MSNRDNRRNGYGGYEGNQGYSPYDLPQQSRRSASPYDRNNAGYNPAYAQQRVAQQPRSFEESQYYRPPAQKKRRNPVIPIVIIVLLLAIAGLGIWFFFNRLSVVPITVNGQEIEVKKGTTVQSLIDEGYASPIAGNLLAIDGSVITPGGGQPNTVTVAGQPATTDYELTSTADVVIGDGADVTEDVTVAEELIPHGWYDDSREFGAYWNGSLHKLSDGQDGLRVTRTGNISGISTSEDVAPAFDGGYHIYTCQTSEPVVALTFDDGPWPTTTAQILDILEQYGAKATFFTIGNQIPGSEDLVRRAHDLGCEVCTHSYDHASGSGQGVNLTYMSADEQIWEITAGYQAITDALGVEPPHIIRAPGGNFYGSIIDTLWPYVDAEVGWDVDTEDWRLPGVDSIVNMILSVQPGQVILMHDGGGDRSQSVEALRQALPVLVERGYRFVTVSELLAM